MATCFVDEVLQQVMVHVGEGLCLRDGRQVVNAKLEAELLQILHMKSGWTDSMRKRTNTKNLKTTGLYGSVPKPNELFTYAAVLGDGCML